MCVIKMAYDPALLVMRYFGSCPPICVLFALNSMVDFTEL